MALLIAGTCLLHRCSVYMYNCNWAGLKTIAVLMLDVVTMVMVILAVITQCFGLRQSVLRYSLWILFRGVIVIFITSSACNMQHRCSAAFDVNDYLVQSAGKCVMVGVASSLNLYISTFFIAIPMKTTICGCFSLQTVITTYYGKNLDIMQLAMSFSSCPPFIIFPTSPMLKPAACKYVYTGNIRPCIMMFDTVKMGFP